MPTKADKPSRITVHVHSTMMILCFLSSRVFVAVADGFHRQRGFRLVGYRSVLDATIDVDIEPEPVAGHRVTPETLGLLPDFVHHNVPLGATLKTCRRNVIVHP